MAEQSSSSRSTAVPFPTDDNILIDLVSHSIQDTFILKKSIDVKSVSGSMKIKVEPSPTPTHYLIRELNTLSISGSLQLDITNQLGPFLLNSSHTSTSGSMKISYPSDWCGTIEMTLGSGSYRIKSDIKDVRVVSDVVNPTNTKERKVLALKGNPTGEYSTLKIQSQSGSVELRFDNRPPLRELTDAEILREEEETARHNSNKEKREQDGAAVTRANAPHIEHPPSYDQSERENILTQVAGRDPN